MTNTSHTRLTVQPNDSSKAGQKASAQIIFGRFHQYAVFAVHVRIGLEVQWFVTYAEIEDEVTGAPTVIRQARTLEAAVDGLDEGQQLRPHILDQRAGGTP
ncbi:MAG: hypothetical protein GY716_15905 [bacterium]|nr:hypothetical protein [bacterium]